MNEINLYPILSWMRVAGWLLFDNLKVEKLLENSKCKLRPQIVTDLTLKTEIQSIAYFSESGVARVSAAGTRHAVEVQANTQTVLPRSSNSWRCQTSAPNVNAPENVIVGSGKCVSFRQCHWDNGGSAVPYFCLWSHLWWRISEDIL